MPLLSHRNQTLDLDHDPDQSSSGEDEVRGIDSGTDGDRERERERGRGRERERESVDRGIASVDRGKSFSSHSFGSNSLSSKSKSLDQLLGHSDIWRASSVSTTPLPTIETGFPPLNSQLAGQGWPTGGVTEILSSQHGIGELSLLIPGLRQLNVVSPQERHTKHQTQARWIALVNPPYIPYAPALNAQGINISHVLLVHPRNTRDALWAAEQALKSGTCAALLLWAPKIEATDIRRLQVAAREGGTWNVLFRPDSAAQQASPAELRLLLRCPERKEAHQSSERSQHDLLDISILKRRGGWKTGFFTVNLSEIYFDPIDKAIELLQAQRKIKINSEKTHSENAHSENAHLEKSSEKRHSQEKRPGKVITKHHVFSGNDAPNGDNGKQLNLYFTNGSKDKHTSSRSASQHFR